MRELIIKLIEALKNMLLGLDKEANPPALLNRNMRLLAFASKEIGVKEVKGKGNNAKVVRYHSFARMDNDVSKGLADSVPWCASFLCYCLEMVGMGSTNAMNARSFLKWGVSSKRDPLPGDIGVFWRGKKKGWQGHCSIYLGNNKWLGGNQSDAVNVSRYTSERLLDIRRSSKMPKLSEVEQDALWSMAGKILAGKKINLNTKVT